MSINLELTEKQYETLAKLVYLGSYMANSHIVLEDANRELERAENYFYSYAEKAGRDDLVEHDKETGEFMFSEKLADECAEFIEEYDNEALWEELIHMLIHRDLDKLYGTEAAIMMDEKTFDAFHDQLEEKYAREFEDHGIDRLVIDEITDK